MPAGPDHLATSTPSTLTLALKRALDVAGSIAGLILLAPFFLIIPILIRLDSPGPAYFRQTRVGLHGRPFRIFKFRTMTIGGSGDGLALTVRADQRITRVGATLRKSKIDELPQLINVLAGDMSLVGPRPEVPEYFQFYSPEQQSVLLGMRPGITDYASILFHDESQLLDQASDPVSVYRHQIMPAKFRHYERYSRDIGIISDLRIILATMLTLVWRVPRRVAQGAATDTARAPQQARVRR